MSDVKIIPISKEYRENYDRIFKKETQLQAAMKLPLTKLTWPTPEDICKRTRSS